MIENDINTLFWREGILKRSLCDLEDLVKLELESINCCLKEINHRIDILTKEE